MNLAGGYFFLDWHIQRTDEVNKGFGLDWAVFENDCYFSIGRNICSGGERDTRVLEAMPKFVSVHESSQGGLISEISRKDSCGG